MINKVLFDKIAHKYGSVCSWALWGDFGEKPKSNMADMDVLNPEINQELLSILKTNVIMIGLNFSHPVNFNLPFMNFHDASPYANDFKIRYAFYGTEYYGSYMTDIIKDHPNNNSMDVKTFLKKNNNIVEESINEFIKEMECIESYKPIIFCFGSQVYNILKSYLSNKLYSTLVPLIHYSHQINKDNYKKDLLLKIDQYINKKQF